MRSFLKLGLCPLLALGAAGCGSSLPTQSREMTSAVVGTTGGMLASSDGALQVSIPAGALAADVTVTIVPTTPPGSGAIGTVYEIGPTGTQFAMPVTLTFDYGATSLGTTDPPLLRVATFAAGSWQILSGGSVDSSAQTVSGTTTHLSPYGVISAATGAMCATVSGGLSCSGGGTAGVSGTAGASSAGDTSGAGGSSGSGGVTNTGDTLCAPSTCAEAINPCGLYPGATMSGCTDGPNGYTATCCFPSGGSICLQAAPATSGCSVDCSAGGSCTTTCPPAPTCADATAATACGGLTGATLQSCVDGTGGYTAACCFAPGAPVCTTVGSASSCGGSTDGTTTCAPAPTCADGDPCAGIAGTTTQSCTDSADGYSAVCCFPVGEVPSSGGGTSASGGAVGGVSGGSDTAGVSGGGGPSTGGDGGGTGTGAASGATGGTTGSGVPTGTGAAGGSTSAGGTTGGGGGPA